ncbi:hypothetical protein B0H11DRAFT_1905143 [Mycena galericulata]|nr:hypothetical protein B0H11DRAFT_1905143 [Mycena galericulata]
MATPNHPRIAAILNSVPSPSDTYGVLYAFYIFRTQPRRRYGRTPKHPRAKVKIGRANNPLRRRREWARQCRGQRQKWWFWWDVPFAKKFERLIHTHFRVHGAWVQPSPCGFCLVRHEEQFDYARCGGKRGLIRVVEEYLGILGWPIVRYSADFAWGAWYSTSKSGLGARMPPRVVAVVFTRTQYYNTTFPGPILGCRTSPNTVIHFEFKSDGGGTFVHTNSGLTFVVLNLSGAEQRDRFVCSLDSKDDSFPGRNSSGGRFVHTNSELTFVISDLGRFSEQGDRFVWYPCEGGDEGDAGGCVRLVHDDIRRCEGCAEDTVETGKGEGDEAKKQGTEENLES